MFEQKCADHGGGDGAFQLKSEFISGIRLDLESDQFAAASENGGGSDLILVELF